MPVRHKNISRLMLCNRYWYMFLVLVGLLSRWYLFEQNVLLVLYYYK